MLTELIEADQLVQKSLDHQNIIEIPGSYVLMQGNDEDVFYSKFYNAYVPAYDNVQWINALMNYTLQGDAAGLPVELKTTLFGISRNGTVEKIEIKKFPSATIGTSPAVFDANFDLASGAGIPSLKKKDGQTDANKIQVDLPLEIADYEELQLKSIWINGWTKKKKNPITGTTKSLMNHTVGPIVIPYDSDIKSDFSDLRVYIWDGKQLIRCCFGIYTKTNGVTATIFVRVPYIAANIGSYLQIFYGNSGASSVSNLTGILYYYDGFEDGLYTGRSAPYKNYSVNSGAAAIVSSGAITGTYSLRHTGGNYSLYVAPMTFAESNENYIMHINAKCLSQGAGSADPYVALLYLKYNDGNNFVRLDTYYDSGSGKQKGRVVQNIAGNFSTLTSFMWSSTRFPVGLNLSLDIAVNNRSISLYSSGSRVFKDLVHGMTAASASKGFGCMQGSQWLFDDIKIVPFNSSFNGVEPSIGALGSEETQSIISADAGNSTDLFGKFTAPPAQPLFLTAKEFLASGYDTPAVDAAARNIFELGVDNVDKYIGLQILTEVVAAKGVTVKANYGKYQFQEV